MNLKLFKLIKKTSIVISFNFISYISIENDGIDKFSLYFE